MTHTVVCEIKSEPPQLAIDAALIAARQSHCDKSRRGVAMFLQMEGEHPWIVGAGWNGLPGSLRCTNDEPCHSTCTMRCVHAEVRAIRAMIACNAYGERWVFEKSLNGFGSFDALHVKIDLAGELVAGGGPSCWQCAREVLDVGLGGFWLYEAPRVGYAPGLDPAAVHATALRLGIDLGIDHYARKALPTWKRYTAAEFHAATMQACALPENS